MRAKRRWPAEEVMMDFHVSAGTVRATSASHAAKPGAMLSRRLHVALGRLHSGATHFEVHRLQHARIAADAKHMPPRPRYPPTHRRCSGQ